MERKYVKTKKIFASLLAALFIIQQPVLIIGERADSPLEFQRETSDIDSGIYNLNYNKNEVLASKGDIIESFIPREGIFNKDKFIVVERNKKSLTTSPIDISIVDSMAHRTYPGALQLADEDFINNQPNLLSARRSPINISIDLPGMGIRNSVKVENPTYGNIDGAVDELISIWNENYSKTHTLPARIQYFESMVHSKSQISSVLNANGKFMEDSLGIDFEAISNGEKKTMVAAYKQIFYTVNAEIPNEPSDLFHSSVSFSDLERKGVSSQTPPVLVSNVAYGRNIYVKLETTSKSNEVQNAFKALLNDSSIDTKLKYEDIFEESTFTAVVLGGDSKEHNKIITNDFDEIRDIIKSNAEFSPKNPAYPISYTSVFLKDNSVAAIHNTTDYVETKSTEYRSGKINIDHYGAYVAQFNINWDELSFDQYGNEILEHKTWDGNWGDKTARFTSVVYLPANAININIYARESTGLAWEWWRTIVDERNVALNKEINLSIGGTTLSPTGNISYN